MSWEEDFGEMIGIPYIDTSYDQPRTSETITSTVAAERQDISGNSNAWGGFWAKAAGQLLDYGIKRDAAMVGVQLQQQRPVVLGAPLSASVGVGAGGLTISPMMLLIGGVALFLVLQK